MVSVCPQQLSKSDPDIYSVVNKYSESNIVLVADHGGNEVPESMGKLGLAAAALNCHIAIDLGVSSLVRGLSSNLQSAALIANYTRLLIDLNRPLGEGRSVVTKSDGINISGNQNISDLEYIKRAEIFYWPYHNTLANLLANIKLRGKTPILISLHTFTPILGKDKRQWNIGVMSANDKRLSSIVLTQLLANNLGLVVGDNQPYSGVKYGHTVRMQAELLGYPYIQLEVRQDLLAKGDQVLLLTDYLAKVLEVATHSF